MMNKEEMKIRRYTPHTKEDCRRAAECIIELKQRIDKAIQFIKEHNKNAGKLYYKYNNKYLLSEIKEDLLEILGGKE